MILAGDIGGTKTNLALYDSEAARDGSLDALAQQQFPSRDYTSLSDVITDFLGSNQDISGAGTIDAACFGIAGPVIDGRCRTTNLPWDITTSGLQHHLGTGRVRLMNDLEATAYGMLYLPYDDFIDLNPTGRKLDGNRAVIAAGTGLGEGFLYWDGSAYHPIGSEGGHTDFAPTTARQDDMLKWMRNHFSGHVSYERILSGPGIQTLYDFLAETGFAPQPASMLNLPLEEDRSARISQCALNENDPLCMETMRLFCEIYGAEAGNLALKCLAVGGVYVGGGIAPKILPIITNNHFINAFFSKGRFEELMHGMQVRIAKNPKTALIGAAHFAADKLFDN